MEVIGTPELNFFDGWVNTFGNIVYVVIVVYCVIKTSNYYLIWKSWCVNNSLWRPLPPVDQALIQLVSPSSSFLGKASFPSKNCRVMEGLITKLQSAVATKTFLANTGELCPFPFITSIDRCRKATGMNFDKLLVPFQHYQGAGRCCRQDSINLWVVPSQLQLGGDKETVRRLSVFVEALCGTSNFCINHVKVI